MDAAAATQAQAVSKASDAWNKTMDAASEAESEADVKAADTAAKAINAADEADAQAEADAAVTEAKADNSASTANAIADEQAWEQAVADWASGSTNPYGQLEADLAAAKAARFSAEAPLYAAYNSALDDAADAWDSTVLPAIQKTADAESDAGQTFVDAVAKAGQTQADALSADDLDFAQDLINDVSDRW